MSENMLTIDRLFDFGVLGFLDTCRLSDIGVVRPFKVCRLSDTGVFEGLIGVRFQQMSVLAVFEGCFTVVGSLFGIKTRGPIFSALLLGDLCDCDMRFAVSCV